MLEDVVPEKRNDDMTNRNWATYCTMVWCNNSLNSYGGRYRHMTSSDYQGYLIGEHKEEDLVVISKSEAAMTFELFNRAQRVIWALLEETGRINEFKEWEKKHEKD